LIRIKLMSVKKRNSARKRCLVIVDYVPVADEDRRR